MAKTMDDDDLSKSKEILIESFIFFPIELNRSTATSNNNLNSISFFNLVHLKRVFFYNTRKKIIKILNIY